MMGKRKKKEPETWTHEEQPQAGCSEPGVELDPALLPPDAEPGPNEAADNDGPGVPISDEQLRALQRTNRIHPVTDPGHN